MRIILGILVIVLFLSTTMLQAQWEQVSDLLGGEIYSIAEYGDNTKKNCSEENNNSLLLLKYEFNNYNKIIASSELSNGETSRKSPWVAFLLSLFLPSTGQIYNGDYTKALIQGGLILGGAGLVAGTACVECGEPESAQTSLFITGLAMVFSGYLWSIIDAPISANNINSELNLVDQQHDKNRRPNTFAKNHKFPFPANNLISLNIKL